MFEYADRGSWRISSCGYVTEFAMTIRQPTPEEAFSYFVNKPMFREKQTAVRVPKEKNSDASSRNRAGGHKISKASGARLPMKLQQ